MAVMLSGCAAAVNFGHGLVDSPYNQSQEKYVYRDQHGRQTGTVERCNYC